MIEEILQMLEEIRPEYDFKESNDYISDGFLDSFDIISLCSMLEEKYGIKVDGMEIVPENFTSLDNIEKLVKKSKS